MNPYKNMGEENKENVFCNVIFHSIVMPYYNKKMIKGKGSIYFIWWSELSVGTILERVAMSEIYDKFLC